MTTQPKLRDSSERETQTIAFTQDRVTLSVSCWKTPPERGDRDSSERQVIANLKKTSSKIQQMAREAVEQDDADLTEPFPE